MIGVTEVVLQEPLTEFTAAMSVDIFDGNLRIDEVPYNGCRTFVVTVAGDLSKAPTSLPVPGEAAAS